MKHYLLYVSIIMLAGLTYLLAPQHIQGLPGDSTSKNYFRINRLMGIRMNSDSPEFIANSANPASLFEPGAKRQSRPLFIMAGTIAGNLVYLLSYPFHDSLRHYIDKKVPDFPQHRRNMALKYGCIYAGYILINIVLMLISFHCFESILRKVGGGIHFSPIIRYALLFFLLSNPVVKYFFWTPHQQIFNILTPLLAVYFAVHIDRFTATGKQRAVLALCCGALLLVYGNFLILYPVITGSYIFFYARQKQPFNIPFAVRLMLMTITWLLPLSAWLLFLSVQKVPIYNYEMASERQLVWILDQATLGWESFISAFTSHTTAYVQTMGTALVPSIFLLLTVISTRNLPVIQMPAIPHKFRVPIGTAMISTLLFFWVLGFYADRLTVSIATLILVVLGIVLNSRRTTTAFNIGFVVLLLCWHVLQVMYNPTSFTPRFFF